MAAPVDFEKILIGVSCLFFILVFAAILFCMTDFKLCFQQNNAQKIFHDSVLENVAAVQRDRENSALEKNGGLSTGSKRSSETSMGLKKNKTHPASDGISDDTITLDYDETITSSKPKTNGKVMNDASLIVIIDQDKIEISNELIVSGLPEGKRKTCKIQKHKSSDEINPMPV